MLCFLITVLDQKLEAALKSCGHILFRTYGQYVAVQLV